MRTVLIQVRKQAGLTQEEVAKRVGIDRSFYAHIERNTRNPSLDIAIKIAELLERSVEEIFHDAPDAGKTSGPDSSQSKGRRS